MLEELLSELKLYGALEFFNDNDYDSIGLPEYLKGMLEAENSRRSSNALKRRVSAAKFPFIREWEQIDEKRNLKIPFKKIEIFSSGEFIKSHTNLCFIGTPGVGKTHCLVAIGRDLCRLGMNVKLYTACDLVNQLEEAKQKYEITKFMDRLMKPQLLIIDELGFVPFTDNGARLLFDVFSKRYERGSIAISTNLSFEKWSEVFGSIELTQALIDRFTHNCEIFTFDGISIRLEESKKRNK